MTREKVYWLCQIAGWGAYVSLGATSMLAGGASPRVVGPYVLSGLAAILVSHAYRETIRRNGWMALPLKPRLLRLVAGSAAFGIVATGVATLGFLAFGFKFDNVAHVAAALLTWFTTMLYWSAAYASVHIYEDYRKAQREQLQLDLVAKESQLRALIAQVNPHFLFNSLNSARALIDENPAKARDTLTRLSHLLRYSLRSSESRTVPLEEELEAVRNYLDCEAVRYEDRLSIEWSIDPAVAQSPVPPMLVQTLVENAIKHGVATIPGHGFLNVSAAMTGSNLALDIVNSGILNGAGSKGTGLANARARLQLLYGDRATLTVAEAPPGRVAAHLELPA